MATINRRDSLRRIGGKIGMLSVSWLLPGADEKARLEIAIDGC